MVFFMPELKIKLPITDVSIQGLHTVAPYTPNECMPQEAVFIMAQDSFWKGRTDIGTGILLELD